jgi:protein TonB
MYRSDLDKRDKSGAIIAVAAVHAALLFVLLHISGRMDLTQPQSVLRVFDVSEVPPPPPEQVPPPPERQPKEKPKAAEGAASPQNIRSKATDVQAPRPPISLPVPVPMETSTTPNQGTQSTQGAANPGPGTGAGGTGTGTGSGGSGSGAGGGGQGGAVTPPHLATPVLRGRDFPREILQRWPGRTTVFLRLRVDARGYVSECTVDRGTGVAQIDNALCNVAHDRLRFRPALNRAGQPVEGWFGNAQPAPR